MVVALAIFFALTFWLLKNTIDAMTGNLVFVAATCLYAVSWGWRAIIDTDSSHLNLLIGLMVITFCSSFFRLAFNKRFFDLARNLNGTHYLLIKSYLSQCILAVFYGILALVLLNMNNNGVSYFPTIYTAAALLSLGYLLYRRP